MSVYISNIFLQLAELADIIKFAEVLSCIELSLIYKIVLQKTNVCTLLSIGLCINKLVFLFTKK